MTASVIVIVLQRADGATETSSICIARIPCIGEHLELPELPRMQVIGVTHTPCNEQSAARISAIEAQP